MKNPLVAFKYLRYPGVLAVTIMTAWVYGGFYATSVTMPIELKEVAFVDETNAVLKVYRPTT